MIEDSRDSVTDPGALVTAADSERCFYILVDFEWYRSFAYIYKYHSVSEAAKTRIMTQPAMSQHLAALETEVGGAFVRQNRTENDTDRKRKGVILAGRSTI
jgi:Transcriptional regulator